MSHPNTASASTCAATLSAAELATRPHNGGRAVGRLTGRRMGSTGCGDGWDGGDRGDGTGDF